MNQILIGKYIQKLRKEKQLTQKMLADKLNISFQAVSKWEVGECLPDTSILLNLSTILGVSVDSLLHGGSYIMNDKKLMRVEDVKKGFDAIDDIKKYFGSDSLFYIGMIDGINKIMNLDLQVALENSKYREVLVCEVLLQGIASGKYYCDIQEVKQSIQNEKLVKLIIEKQEQL